MSYGHLRTFGCTCLVLLLLSTTKSLLALLCVSFLTIAQSTRAIATTILHSSVFVFHVMSPSSRIHITIPPHLRISLCYNGLIPSLSRLMFHFLLSCQVLTSYSPHLLPLPPHPSPLSLLQFPLSLHLLMHRVILWHSSSIVFSCGCSCYSSPLPWPIASSS